MRQPKTLCAACSSRPYSMLDKTHDELLTHVDAAKTCNHFKKGQFLFFEGNTPQGLYCVSSGVFKVFKTGPSGKEQILHFAQPGDFIGYRTLLLQEPYDTSAIAVEDGAACFIPREQFRELLGHDPHLPQQMLGTLARELGVAGERLLQMAQKSVRGRVAETLLMLLDAFRVNDQQQKLIKVKLPREDIANLAGTSTESAIRQLTDFKEEGLVALNGKLIQILNKEALMRIAQHG